MRNGWFVRQEQGGLSPVALEQDNSGSDTFSDGDDDGTYVEKDAGDLYYGQEEDYLDLGWF